MTKPKLAAPGTTSKAELETEARRHIHAHIRDVCKPLEHAPTVRDKKHEHELSCSREAITARWTTYLDARIALGQKAAETLALALALALEVALLATTQCRTNSFPTRRHTSTLLGMLGLFGGRVVRVKTVLLASLNCLIPYCCLAAASCAAASRAAASARCADAAVAMSQERALLRRRRCFGAAAASCSCTELSSCRASLLTAL